MSTVKVTNRPITSRIIRKPELKERFGLADSTLYDAIRAKKFPAQIKLSSRSVGWLSDEVEAWFAERIAASRKVPA